MSAPTASNPQRGEDDRSPFIARNGDRLEDMPGWDPVRQVFVLDRSRRALSQQPSTGAATGHTGKAAGPSRRRK